MEYVQIGIASFCTGPLTWPIALQLLHRQQGRWDFRFFECLRVYGLKQTFAGCSAYTSYKLFGIGIQRGVQLPVQNYLFQQQPRWNNGCIFAASGVVSGIIGGFIVTPIEQLKISLAARGMKNYADIRYTFLSSFYGVQGLFSGARATMVRNVVFDSVNAVLYNGALVTGWINRQSPFQIAVVNAVAGVITAVVDYPLDVMKTAVQIDTVRRLNSGVQTTPSLWSIFRDIVNKHGVKGLYFGLEHKLGLYFAVWGTYGASFTIVGNLLSSTIHDK